MPNKRIVVLCIGSQEALRARRSAQLSRPCTRCSRVNGPRSVLAFAEATPVAVIVTVCVRRRLVKERLV